LTTTPPSSPQSSGRTSSSTSSSSRWRPPRRSTNRRSGMTTSPSTLSSPESPPLGASGAAAEVNVIELKPGLKVSVGSLRTILPDVETLLFFGKLFSLDYSTLSYLITTLFKSDVITELFGKGCCHSTELQGYIVSTVPEEVRREHGNGSYSTDVPAPNT